MLFVQDKGKGHRGVDMTAVDKSEDDEMKTCKSYRDERPAGRKSVRPTLFSRAAESGSEGLDLRCLAELRKLAPPALTCAVYSKLRTSAVAQNTRGN